ncbi:MAG: 50S ribosomal protein L25 [Truepera sp.]|nr:50S ribosomal protein L25 [Truepera sp.]
MKLLASRRTPGKAGALRLAGQMPAVVYNRELNIPIAVDLKTFDRVFRVQGTSSIIDLEIDGQNHEVLVKQVQMDKRKRLPVHADFYAVTAGQLVDVYIPLEFVGTAAGSREGGQLDVQRREVHISILPRLIPQHLMVDVSALKIGDSLHVSDLKALLPAEAEILDDLELTLVAVVPPRVAEETVAEAAATEPEVIAKGKEEEE